MKLSWGGNKKKSFIKEKGFTNGTHIFFSLHCHLLVMQALPSWHVKTQQVKHLNLKKE